MRAFTKAVMPDHAVHIPKMMNVNPITNTDSYVELAPGRRFKRSRMAKEYSIAHERHSPMSYCPTPILIDHSRYSN